MEAKRNKVARTPTSDHNEDSALPLDLHNFRLDQLIFEARIPPALLLWDRAGEMWQSFMVSHPNIELMHAEPIKTQFLIDRKYDVSIELQRIGITGYVPPNPDETFSRIVNDVINLAVKYLGVEVFNRIGVRSIFFKQFQNEEEAQQALHSTNLVSTAKRQHFGINETPVTTRSILRWEDDVKGMTISTQIETRALNVELPVQIVNYDFSETLVKPYKETGIVFDADSYIKRPVEVSQFRAQDFISQSLQTVLTDGTLLLQGK